MVLERVPAYIWREGGVARMTDPKLIKEIMAAVTIPVFLKLGLDTLVKLGFFNP